MYKVVYQMKVYTISLSDRHKSFRLRLPSIRRDIRRSSQDRNADDVENPPDGEESMPLHQLPTIPAVSPLQEQRAIDRDFSDQSNFSNEEARRGSPGSLRRASSYEHIDSSTRSPKGRTKSTSSGTCLVLELENNIRNTIDYFFHVW